jgi:hypothetical protein
MFHGRLKLPFKNRDPLSWVARCDGFPETKSICSSSSRRSPSGRAFMHARLNSRRALLQFGGVSYGAIERDPAVKAGSVEGKFPHLQGQEDRYRTAKQLSTGSLANKRPVPFLLLQSRSSSGGGKSFPSVVRQGGLGCAPEIRSGSLSGSGT